MVVSSGKGALQKRDSERAKQLARSAHDHISQRRKAWLSQEGTHDTDTHVHVSASSTCQTGCTFAPDGLHLPICFAMLVHSGAVQMIDSGALCGSSRFSMNLLEHR